MRGAVVKLVVLAVLLALAGALVVAGVALWSVPVALVVAGVLLAVLACLFLLDVGPAARPGERA